MRYFRFDDKKYGFNLQMDLHRFEGNPHLDFEPNVHTIDFFEIMFFEAGDGNLFTNDHIVEILPRTILFSSPNQIKKCPISEESAKGYHLVFKSDFLERFFQDKLFVYRLNYFYNYNYSPYLVLSGDTYKLIATCLSEVIDEIELYRKDSIQIIRSLLYFILCKLNREFNSFHHINEGDRKEDILIRYKIAIEEHITSNKNINDFANLIGIGRNVLNQKIKSYTGLTANEFLVQRKIQEIKTRLLFSSKTISEISFDLNFSDPNNLTRFFKSKEGITPTQYRSIMQNDR